MALFAQNGQQFPILDKCREINNGINKIEESLSRLEKIQQHALDDPDVSTQSSIIQQLDADYQHLAGRIKSMKKQPDSREPINAPHIRRIDRRLKDIVQAYYELDSTFRKNRREQRARQYRIVRPEATEEEVQKAVEDTASQQVFSQALLQSNRRGQSRTVLNAVQSRHQDIEKMVGPMIELGKLFQDMESLVVQQENPVESTEINGEQVMENTDKGTEQIGVAIESARNIRKWRWWCLGVCSMFILPSLFKHKRELFTNLVKNSPYSRHRHRHNSHLQIRRPRRHPLHHDRQDETISTGQGIIIVEHLGFRIQKAARWLFILTNELGE